MAETDSLEIAKPNISTNGNSLSDTRKDNDVVLKVDNLSKKFCRNLRRSMYYGIRDLAKGLVGKRPDPGELRRDEFWALKDINFELKENEILGIIGANGSGKSTLLRVLTGIYPPDKGRVWMDGTVGGIIALGAGMHPHMTGRENIYLNGTILGMSKEEIDEKFDDIVDFAEIGDFLDAPFNTYSSGMRVRLGFAVAVHFKPDILLVDEVLAVGDLSFHNKCMKKLSEIREKSNGVIFISHNLNNVELICNEVIVLNRGQIYFKGDTKEAISKYEELQNRSGRIKDYKHSKFEIISSGKAYLKSAYATDLEDNKRVKFGIRQPLKLVFELEVEENIDIPYISVALRNEKGENIYWELNTDTELKFHTIEKGKRRIEVTIHQQNLEPGKYYLVYGIKNADTGEYHEKNVDQNNYIIIKGDRPKRGIVNFNTEWTIK